MWDAMITVGRIVRPHGRRGAVVIEPESDFASDRFREGAEVHWLRDGTPSAVRIASSREFRGRWVVTLEGVTSMSEAEALRGAELRVPVASLRALDAGTFYVHELHGCAVTTTSGQLLGRVARVDFGAGTPVLAVAGDDGDEVLIPLAEDICREIDTAAGRIVVDPPAGLVELNRAARR